MGFTRCRPSVSEASCSQCRAKLSKAFRSASEGALSAFSTHICAYRRYSPTSDIRAHLARFGAPQLSAAEPGKLNPGAWEGSVQNCSVDGYLWSKLLGSEPLFLEFVRGELLEGISSLQSLPVGETCGVDLDQIGPMTPRSLHVQVGRRSNCQRCVRCLPPPLPTNSLGVSVRPPLPLKEPPPQGSSHAEAASWRMVPRLSCRRRPTWR